MTRSDGPSPIAIKQKAKEKFVFRYILHKINLIKGFIFFEHLLPHTIILAYVKRRCCRFHLRSSHHVSINNCRELKSTTKSTVFWDGVHNRRKDQNIRQSYFTYILHVRVCV
jgi:hypothetical protein